MQGFPEPTYQMNQAENHDDGCGGPRASKDTQIAPAVSSYWVAASAAISAAIELERALGGRRDVNITLVTRDNYFLFTPMLHEVAASDLEVNTIVNPLRKLLRQVKTFTGNIETINLE